MPTFRIDIPEDLLARIDHHVELRRRTREELMLEWLRNAVGAPWDGDFDDGDRGPGSGDVWDDG